MYMLLTQGTKVSSGSDNAVSRKVWIFLCSTHNLKAARNSLFRSQIGGTRNCMIGDVPFGWQAIIACWKCELKKSTNDASVNLNETSVYLDKWAKMNVKYAMMQSTMKLTWRTVTTILTFLETRDG